MSYSQPSPITRWRPKTQGPIYNLEISMEDTPVELNIAVTVSFQTCNNNQNSRRYPFTSLFKRQKQNTLFLFSLRKFSEFFVFYLSSSFRFHISEANGIERYILFILSLARFICELPYFLLLIQITVSCRSKHSNSNPRWKVSPFCSRLRTQAIPKRSPFR